MTRVKEEGKEGRDDILAVERFEAVEPPITGAVVDEEEAVFEATRGSAVTISNV